MMLSILIVNWNTRDDLLRCLSSVFACPPAVDFEVLVVDNASGDDSAEAVGAAFPQVRLIVSPENLGFARGNNLAAAQAEGEFLLLLNPDTWVHAGALERLVQYLDSQPRVGAVGPRLLNPDGSLQPSVYRLPTLFREWWRLFHLDRLYAFSQYSRDFLAAATTHPVESLNGACLLLRREALAGMRLFDDDYFMYSEEVDLCDRLHRAGWELHWLPAAEVTHTGGQSTRQAADKMFVELYRNKVKFFRKRRGRLAASLYKVILLQASLFRFCLGQLGRLAPSLSGWREVARQYRLLLAALPRL